MKNIIELLAPSEDNNNHGKLTNQSLINRIEEEFEAKLVNASTYDTVLFPMSFTILLHPDNYDDISPYFASIVQSIVAKFYQIIRKHRNYSLMNKIIGICKKESGPLKKVMPIGRNWEFILSKTDISMIGDLAIGINNPAFLISATARVYGNVNKSPSVNVSIACQNSDPSETKDINIETLKGINLIGNNHFLIAYNKELEFKNTDIESNDSSFYYGTLQYVRMGHKYTFYIKDEIVSISSENDTREQRNIFKIPSSNLQNNHVQIKYDKLNESFFISTIASDTRLNQRIMQQSIGSPIWIPLYNNSEILMMGTYSIKFLKK